MMKAFVLLCASTLAVSTAAADPTAPAPDGSGSDSGSGAGSGAPTKPTKPDERAGTNETLQNGGIERPWAAGVPMAEQQTALGTFHEGNVQLNDGLFAKASESYRSALKHWDHPAIHYNLALAQMNLDQPIAAYDNMIAAIHYGEAPLQSRDKYDHAKDYLLLLQKQIADVTVVCKKTGAKVTIDGQLVFTAPGTYTGKVRVGKHTFVAELEGHPTRIDAPFISPGENFRIELQLYTVMELTRYKRRWQATWLPYAVGAGAVVLAGAGGVLEALSNSSYKDYDARIVNCNQGTTSGTPPVSAGTGCAASSSLSSLRNRANDERVAGGIGYGLAGATLAAASVLWLLERPQSYQGRPEDMSELPAGSVTFAPTVTPSFAGAVAQGHF
jgi:hypothetical protein